MQAHNPPQPDPRDRSAGSKVVKLLKASGALAALLAVLVGPPTALVLWGNWPITGLPSGDLLGDLPMSLATEDALFGAMTLAAGFVWLLFLVSAAIETIAELQNRHLADVPLAGPIQTFVRKLVAAAMLSVSATGAPAGSLVIRRAAAPAPAPGHGPRSGGSPGPRALPAAGGHTSVGYQPGPPRPPTQDLRSGGPGLDRGVATPRVRHQLGARSGGSASPGGPPAAGSGRRAGDPSTTAAGSTGSNGRSAPPGGPRRVVVVGELDTPWSLAEEHLGDGMAWRELFEANRDRPQADGRAWTDPEVLEPGWKLVLPQNTVREPDPEDLPDLSATLDPETASGTGISSDRDPQPGTRSALLLVPGPDHAADEGPVEGAQGMRTQIDVMCRALTDDLVHAPAADLVGLRASAESIDVLLAAPATPPAGFEAGATDTTLWRAVSDGSAPLPEQRIRRNVPLLPALVDFGRTPEGMLLFDIERLGALSVEGDPGQVWLWLTGVAREIASAPWSRDVALRVAGLPGLNPGGLTGRGDVEVVDTLSGLAEEAAAFAMATSTALDQRSTQAARSAGGGPWSPMVVVTGAEVPAELLSLCRFGGGGLAVVAAGPLPEARWRFVIDAAGQAVLHPWGVRCTIPRSPA